MSKINKQPACFFKFERMNKNNDLVMLNVKVINQKVRFFSYINTLVQAKEWIRKLFHNPITLVVVGSNF